MTSSTFIAHPFAPIFLQRSPSTARSTLRRSRYACAATRRPSICCSDARVPDGTPEPVKDGVDLPEVGKEALETHTSWLEIEVRTWLDSEWRDKDAWKAHHQISVRTAQIYRRLRIEGMNDLTSILLGLGGDLEDADFSKTYTGPWDVANKAAELLIERFLAGGLGDQRDAPQPEASKEQWSVLTEMNRQPELDDSYIASAPSLSDEFERYRFLQMVLDGSATKALIDGAVAVAMGFTYDENKLTWDGSGVTNDYFQRFGDDPPDVLGDETILECTETLDYLEKQLGLDEDDEGKLEASLMVVIEALHGTEMTRIQMTDDDDHAFKKRVALAKWLHLLAGF